MKWQTIGTAPKDGSSILLLIEDCAIEGYYDTMSNDWRPISLPSHGCGCCGGYNDAPSYWSPLPEK